MVCNYNYLLLIVWLLIVKTDKHILLLWLSSYYSFNNIVSCSTKKWWNSISPKLGSNRKTCNHFLKSRCISELSWNFLKNTNAQVLLFSSRGPDVSNEQSCLKTTGLYDDLLLLSSLFHFFYFIFSDPISFSLCSPIYPSLSPFFS